MAALDTLYPGQTHPDPKDLPSNAELHTLEPLEGSNSPPPHEGPISPPPTPEEPSAPSPCNPTGLGEAYATITRPPLSLPPPLPPSQSRSFLPPAVQQAYEAGSVSLDDLGDTCTYPVLLTGANAPQYQNLSLKLVRELKSAINTYGLQSKYVQGILASMTQLNNDLLISDWRSLLSMLLSPTQYMLWSSEYNRLTEAAINGNNLPANVTRDDVLGEGTRATIAQQINSDRATFPFVRTQALAALRKVDDDSGVASETFTRIYQEPKESYASFISRLQTALDRQVDNQAARNELIMRLAYENANADCQAVLKPLAHRPGIALTDYLIACRVVGTVSHKAACYQASSSFSSSGVMALQKPSGNCYNCNKPGHFRSQCKLPGGGAWVRDERTFSRPHQPNTSVRPKKICPRCHKGFHWASQCRSNPPPPPSASASASVSPRNPQLPFSGN